MIDINLSDDGTTNALITNKLELFLQEVALSVKIGPTEIWGIAASIDLTKYLFNQYISRNNIQNEITTFIGNNCSMANEFQYDITVEILNIDQKDLIYILFKVYDDNNDMDVIQKFLLGT